MPDETAFERALYLARRVIANRARAELGPVEVQNFYIVTLSCRTVVYKGMFLSYQVGEYYLDLHDPRFASALALVHQRFSTNTFPSWRLAHPYRMICHNGEINTLRGNVNWMAARQASVSSPLFGENISKLWPISFEGQSDTACFDNALEFLVQGGYSLAHAMMLLIPEAWAGNQLMDEKRHDFYQYHASLMEPWDGPAAIAFTDGRQIGATLDRNGLRPARYIITSDDRVILASEAGVLTVPEEMIVHKWRLQPGKMLLIDLEKGGIISDDEIKAQLANAHPYREWLNRGQLRVEALPHAEPSQPKTNIPLLDRQQAFGYTQESWKFLLSPMIETGQEAIGSMGTDTPISALSSKPKLLHTYFKQNFAQVTNPPIDPIREELVMSLVSFIGPRPNILDLEGSSNLKWLEVSQPILTNDELERIRRIAEVPDAPFKTINARHHLCGRPRRVGHGALARLAVHAGRKGRARWLEHHHRVGSRGRSRPHSDPEPSRHERDPPSPDPQGSAHLGRPCGRDGRSARDTPIRRSGGLWRGGHQPVSRLRDDRSESRRASISPSKRRKPSTAM